MKIIKFQNLYWRFAVMLVSCVMVGCSPDIPKLLEEGKEAFYNQQYEEAKNAFSKCAELGDSQGQFWLALTSLSAPDTLNMSKEEVNRYIFDLFKKSAEQNDGDGYYGLYDCYMFGRGVEKDEKVAYEYLDKSVELNSMWGYAYKGAELVYGLNGKKDVEKGIQLIKKSAESGNYIGMVELAKCLYDGVGIAEDTDKALKLLKQASDQNVNCANDLLAIAYFSGAKIPQDFGKAYDYATKGTMKGSTMYIVSYCYTSGNGVEEDRGKGAFFARQSALLGFGPGQALWAGYCEDGYGTPQEAFEFYMKASEQGVVSATTEVGKFLLMGTAGKVDYPLAKRYLIKAASQGDDEARSLLANYSLLLGY